MKLEVNITKTRAFAIVGAVLILAGIFGVVAYNSAGNPSVFGHSINEIDWSGSIPSIDVQSVKIQDYSVTKSGSGLGAVGTLTAINYERWGSLAHVFLDNALAPIDYSVEWDWDKIVGNKSVVIKIGNYQGLFTPQTVNLRAGALYTTAQLTNNITMTFDWADDARMKIVPTSFPY